MINLIETDKAYLAGIMDGEGTIAISRHRKHQRHNWSYALFCNITNTNLELLQWIKLITHLGIIAPKPRSNINWKTCFQWNLRVEEIPRFLPVIMPYMKVRLEQSKLMMEFIGTIRFTSQYAPLSNEESSLKNAIFVELEALNRRGRS